jgi:hypothetical protein
MASQPYSIPCHRDVTPEEHALLKFLIEREEPSRIGEVDEAKVVARCGCGKCPTILLRRAGATDPLTRGAARELASYRGSNPDGIEVGVILIERNGELAELEAWAPAGGDVTSWPPLANLERFPWK